MFTLVGNQKIVNTSYHHFLQYDIPDKGPSPCRKLNNFNTSLKLNLMCLVSLVKSLQDQFLCQYKQAVSA